MHLLRTALSALFVLGCASLGACVADQKETRPNSPNLAPAPAGTLTVGLSAGVANTQGQVDAIAAFVKQATGRATRTAIFPDYDGLADAMVKGQVDVALLPPLAYVRTEGKVEMLVRMMRNGQPTYRSVLFTKAGSNIKSADDLKTAHNLKVAWVDSSSATGYIFPKALLMSKKIDPAGLFVSQDFVGSHDAVCKAVSTGKVDLGATYSDDTASQPVSHVSGCQTALGDTGQLQIVLATENIPNDVLAVKVGFNADDKAKLLAAANGLINTPEGKTTLQKAFNAEGVTTVEDSDFEPVRRALEVFHQ
jgi:phosphonate transport system substrate-binding protein